MNSRQNIRHLWIIFLLSACGQNLPFGPPGEVACGVPAPASGPWYATVAPAEHGNDSRRTHRFAAACSTVSADQPDFVVASADGLGGLYNMVTREPGEVFALGNAFGNVAENGGPYVAKVDARSMQVVWRTPLPGLGPQDWNYPGAMGVHGNGDLYAVYGPNLARLDAATGKVKGVAKLPVNSIGGQAAGDVGYNGFVLLSDGRIVTKSIHRKPGCKEPDFMAFLACDTSGMAASTIALVNPETMQVEQTLIAPEHIRFRATVAMLDGVEYVYMPGEERIRRYKYEGGKLHEDAWSATYRAPGQAPATAVAALGEWIIIQPNGIPAAAPLTIVAVSQRDPAKQYSFTPFPDSKVDGSFIPSLPTVDEDNHRVYTFDGFAGELAALDFDPARGFSLAWRTMQRSFAFSALVGPPQARVLVGTDMDGFAADVAFRHLGLKAKRKLISQKRQPPAERIVWRDAATGAQIAHTPLLAAVGGGVPTPAHYGWLLVPDLRNQRLLRIAPAKPN